MIITAQTPEVEFYEIFDCRGNKIPYVTYFDTETCEIEVALRVIPKEGEEITFLAEADDEGNSRDCLIRFVLKGAYAEFNKPEPTTAE